MLTKRYMTSTKNLDAILTRMVDGAAPDKFTNEHLKSIGFSSSNDRSLIPLLKDLGFLTPEGAPTETYRAYRDKAHSARVLGAALRSAYEDLFTLREALTSADRKSIEGMFRSKLNSTDRVAAFQASTFLALLSKADLKGAKSSTPAQADIPQAPETGARPQQDTGVQTARTGVLNAELHYTIQIHLPATKDPDVFNAIFKSLRENLSS